MSYASIHVATDSPEAHVYLSVLLCQMPTSQHTRCSPSVCSFNSAIVIIRFSRHVWLDFLWGLLYIERLEVLGTNILILWNHYTTWLCYILYSHDWVLTGYYDCYILYKKILIYLFNHNYCLFLNTKVLVIWWLVSNLKQWGLDSSARYALYFTWCGSSAGGIRCWERVHRTVVERVHLAVAKKALCVYWTWNLLNRV
jgi:hypothetical protein